MTFLELLFWILIGLVFYSYIGYGLVLYTLVSIKRWLSKPKAEYDDNYEPEVTLLIAAYNELDYIDQKVKNTRSLDYPSHKLKQLWVTDGSDDGTPDLLQKYTGLTVLHRPERNGKIAAINRAMQTVNSPIVIFSDANTDLGHESIRRIVALFRDPKTGGVSGEKRIIAHKSEDAAVAGESLYWKYESMLKRWDAQLNSTVGAAGELFAIRTELFQETEKDTLLDDFMIAMRIAMKGYSIQYDPEAYAIESASADVSEELKRKIRISAGGIQSVFRLLPLLNVFKYKTLSFQYISHRVLRWIPAPLALIVILVLNAILIPQGLVYWYAFIAQAVAYTFALIGWLAQKRKIRIKVFFVPYYFVVMNYAMIKGMVRYGLNTQSVNWERAARGKATVG